MKQLKIYYRERFIYVTGAIDLTVKFSTRSVARTFLTIALKDKAESYLATISAIRYEDTVYIRLDTSMQKESPFSGQLLETHSDQSATFIIEMPDQAKLFPLTCGAKHIQIKTWQKQLHEKAKKPETSIPESTAQNANGQEVKS